MESSAASNAAKKLRCFVAVDLAEEVRARLTALQKDLAESGADVRWVRVEGLHITLKFLGYLENARLEQVRQVVCRVASGYQPWQVRLRGLSAFPSLRRPRVLWVGVEDEGQLVSVATRLEDELVALGFDREDRPFTPHITLGRVNGLRRWGELEERLKGYLGTSWGESRVDRVIIYRSDLQRGGAVYTPLWTMPLEENRGKT